jgi:hypothetical protein
MKNKLILLCVSLILNGCAWVELTSQGEQVRIISAADAAACDKLGQTTATVADSIGVVKRRNDIIAANLEKLARNTAADMKGNAIVAVSPIENGKQSFDVYRCTP